jgi:hypothetical protein
MTAVESFGARMLRWKRLRTMNMSAVPISWFFGCFFVSNLQFTIGNSRRPPKNWLASG